VTANQNVLVRPPAHEALWPTNLFQTGIGWVIVARLKSAGQRVEAGIFLVDVFCLGVKLAIYESCGQQDYLQRIRGYYDSDFPMAVVDPRCALKLVEQAALYAKALGFAPHPDYKKAARVFGGVRADEWAQHFTFGHNNKPFYRRGPREIQEQALRIVHHLEKRLGSGNYHYDVLLGEAKDITRALDL
jgi:hypothetical protein